MRTTTTAAWTAALAVMSMRGPFTLAEAAPARPQDQHRRPQDFFPKHLRRGGYNSSAPAVESSSSAPSDTETDTETTTTSHHTLDPHPQTQEPPITHDEPSTHTKRPRTSTRSTPSEDEMLSSFLAEGLLPMTENTLVTTTMTLLRNTYTITYTETDTDTSTHTDTHTHTPTSTSHSSSSIPIPLTTSISVPLFTHTHPEETTSTKSTHRQTEPYSSEPVESSAAPRSSSSSEVVSSSSAPHSSLPYPDGNSSSTYVAATGYSSSLAALSSSEQFSSSSIPASSSAGYSSSAPLSSSYPASSSGYESSSVASSSDGGFFGASSGIIYSLTHLTGIPGKPTTHPHDHPNGQGTGGLSLPSVVLPTSHTTKTHPTAAASSSSSVVDSGTIIGSHGIIPLPGHTGTGHHETGAASSAPATSLPTGTNGIFPPHEPSPTGPHQSEVTHTPDTQSSSSGHIIVGLSTTISVPAVSARPHHDHPGHPGFLTSDHGLTGLPTGITLPSGIPTGIPTGASDAPPASSEGASNSHPGNQRPHGIPGVSLSLTSDFSTLSASGLTSDLTKHLPTGVLPPSSEVAPTGGSKTTGTIVPPLGSVVPTLPTSKGVFPSSGAIPTGDSKTTDATISPIGSVVPTLPTSNGVFPSSGAVPTGGSSSTTDGILPPVVGSMTGVTGALTSVVSVPSSPVPNGASGVVSTLSSIVNTGSTSSTLVVPPVPVPIDTSSVATLPLTTAVIPSGTAGSNPATGLPLTTPTSLTVTGAGTTMTVPVPSNTVGTSVITGADGTTVVPIPTASGGAPAGSSSPASPPNSYTDVTTTTPDQATTTTPTSTAGDSTTSTLPNYGSTTISTSIPLTSGTTVNIGSTGVLPSSYVEPTSSAGTSTPVVTKPSSAPATHSASHTASNTASVPVSQPAPTPSDASSTTAPTLTSADTTKHTTAPETIQPTGTDSATSLTLPTSWVFAPTRTKNSDGISTALSSSNSVVTGVPTYIPQLVQPQGGMPSPPPNATLIQLGFDYGLNYEFVVSQPQAASQIFEFLPQGLAYGLGISADQILMHALMPYDTSDHLNFITTLAYVYIPSPLVTELQNSLHVPVAQVYANPDTPVRTLMKMINPSIPLLPGSSVADSPSSAWYNPAATATSSTGDGAPIGGDTGLSHKVRGTSVGIGVGAVCGAAAYAAAMVYVARRYRKKKQGHQRASSVPTVGEMSQTSGGGMGGFFMSGANGRHSGSGSGSGGRGSRTSAGSGNSNGRSVREQGISAPIMAENSLGWT